MAPFTQLCDGVFIVALPIQPAFAEPVVERYADGAEIIPDYAYHLFPGQVTDLTYRRQFAQFQKPGAFRSNNVARDVLDVVALIPVVRHRGFSA